MELTKLLIFAVNIIVACCNKCPFAQHERRTSSIQKYSLIKSTPSYLKRSLAQLNNDYGKTAIDFKLVKLDILELLKSSKSFWPAGLLILISISCY